VEVQGKFNMHIIFESVLNC